MTAQVVPAAAARPVLGLVCPSCGDRLAAVVPAVNEGPDVAIEAKDPAGDYVAVETAAGWRCRKLTPGEDAPLELRRRGHWCVYRYRCYGLGGKCPDRARLFPGGTFCDQHRPGSVIN